VGEKLYFLYFVYPCILYDIYCQELVVDRLHAVERHHELSVELTADRLLAWLLVGLRAEPRTGMRRAAPRPAVGLSKDHISPLPMRNGVDSVDIRRRRRVYKTRWERAKRRRLREQSVEVVSLAVSRSLAKKLHAATPKGVGFNNFLMRLLSVAVGGKPLAVQRVKVGRNERCSCGSGRKWKHCCGKEVLK
jgi:hypothetical protein